VEQLEQQARDAYVRGSARGMHVGAANQEHHSPGRQ
jgi:hypothetical protein